MRRLEGQVAIVTGAGRGIGRAIALVLATEGAHVILCARTQAELDAVAMEIHQLGGQALAIVADVTNAQQVNQMVQQTKMTFGDIHILVNNAGGLPNELYAADGSLFVAPTLWEIPEEHWDRILAVNFKSVFLCLKAVMPHLIQQQRGEIINIISQAGRTLFPPAADYCTAKHAAMVLTEVAALQASPHGVRVNAISPGLIDTPGQRRLLATFMPVAQFPPMVAAETVAAAALYLLCDAPKEMNGQSLDLFKTGG